MLCGFQIDLSIKFRPEIELEDSLVGWIHPRSQKLYTTENAAADKTDAAPTPNRACILKRGGPQIYSHKVAVVIKEAIQYIL